MTLYALCIDMSRGIIAALIHHNTYVQAAAWPFHRQSCTPQSWYWLPKWIGRGNTTRHAEVVFGQRIKLGQTHAIDMLPCATSWRATLDHRRAIIVEVAHTVDLGVCWPGCSCCGGGGSSSWSLCCICCWRSSPPCWNDFYILPPVIVRCDCCQACHMGVGLALVKDIPCSCQRSSPMIHIIYNGRCGSG